MGGAWVPPIFFVLSPNRHVFRTLGAYLVPLITNSGVFELVIISAISTFLVSDYMDWVLLIVAILYGYRTAARGGVAH
jgi:hypothetical protein